MCYRPLRGVPGTGEVGTIYVLHFPHRYRHAAHYVGWTSKDDVAERMAAHVAGKGSPLVYAMCQAEGIETAEQLLACVVHTEVADRHRERQLKNRGGASRWCPACQPRQRAA